MNSLAQNKKLSIDEYYQIAKDHDLHEDSRVELIEGEIITITPIGRKHASIGSRMGKYFEQQFGDDVIVWQQYPIQLGSYSEPQPDITLLHYRTDFYEDRLPTEKDIYLIIEISDSSYSNDSTTKQKLYAKFAIPEYWILNLENNTLEVYLNPSSKGYTKKTIYTKDDQITIQQFPNFKIFLKELIGE